MLFNLFWILNAVGSLILYSPVILDFLQRLCEQFALISLEHIALKIISNYPILAINILYMVRLTIQTSSVLSPISWDFLSQWNYYLSREIVQVWTKLNNSGLLIFVGFHQKIFDFESKQTRRFLIKYNWTVT